MVECIEHKASIFMPGCRCKFKGNSNQWIYRVPFVNPIWDFVLMKIWTGGNIFTMLSVFKSIIRNSYSKIDKKLLAAEDIKYTV